MGRELSKMASAKVIKLSNGEEYTSISALCKTYGLPRGPFEVACKSGGNIDTVLAEQLHKKDTRDRLYNAFGETSMKKVCRKYRISDEPVRELIESGIDIVDAFNIVISNKRQVVCFRDMQFESKESCCKYFGVNVATIYKESYRTGLDFYESLENYLTRHMKEEYIIIFGKRYKNLTDACREFSIRSTTVRNRIDRQIEVSVAIVADRVDEVFLGINGKAYYTVPWCSEPVTARQIIEHNRSDLVSAYDMDNPNGEYRPYKRG